MGGGGVVFTPQKGKPTNRERIGSGLRWAPRERSGLPKLPEQGAQDFMNCLFLRQ